jgi:hypothetical protein
MSMFSSFCKEIITTLTGTSNNNDNNNNNTYMIANIIGVTLMPI